MVVEKAADKSAGAIPIDLQCGAIPWIRIVMKLRCHKEYDRQTICLNTLVIVMLNACLRCDVSIRTNDVSIRTSHVSKNQNYPVIAHTFQFTDLGQTA